MTTPTFEKSIRYDHGDFRAELDGQLIGYYPSYHAAEEALDDVAYERLIHGDTATAEELDGGQPDAYTLAADAGAFGPQTPTLVNWNSATASADPPAPEPNPLGDEEGDSTPPDRPRAQTLQSLAIESKLTTCGFCQGIHHIQKCETLRRALTAAAWVGADLGRALCQMRWCSHASFVELLESAAPSRLVEYADSYLAFLRDYNPDSSLTRDEVLTAWARNIGRAVEMQRAA
jgi:hypothetical protein